MTDSSTINLSRILSHLDYVLLSPDANPELLRSRYERNRVGANFEYARSLLLRLEHTSAHVKIASRKQALQADLQTKRELVKRLQARLQELNEMEDDEIDFEDENEGKKDDITSHASESIADGSLGLQTSSAPEFATHLSSTVRNRNFKSDQPTMLEQPTQSSRDDSTLSEKGDLTSLQDRETRLSADRNEQESIAEALIKLSQQLKRAAVDFGQSVESEKRIVDRAAQGLDRNVDGMGQTGKRMGALQKLTEGKGWWGRVKLYVWIAILWLAAFILVFVMPKLRF